MPATDEEQAATELVRSELESLRAAVAGVRGSIAATADGFLLASDASEVEPTQLAALVATLHSVATRTTLAAGQGAFREAVVRGNDGYLAVYAAGHSAIVAIAGAGTLNVGMLQHRARDTVERIAAHTANLSRWPGAAAVPGRAGQRSRAGGTRALPVRRAPAS